MKLGIFSGRYKAISYKISGRGKHLIIVFPRAGVPRFESYGKLIERISKFGAVLFLRSGYFGIGEIDSDNIALMIDDFSKLLHELVIKLGCKKVSLIGESVGAIHALNYAGRYPKETEFILLSNPAFYRPRLIYSLILIPFLNIAIKTSPDFFLKVFGNILKFLPHKDLKDLGGVFIRMKKIIGARSYLFSLKEIVNFSKRYQSIFYREILNRPFILCGSNDKVFRLFCDTSFCRNNSHFIEIPSAGHGIIDNRPEEVSRVLDIFLPKS